MFEPLHALLRTGSQHGSHIQQKLGTHGSCAVMNEIYPPLEGNPSLLPQLLHGVSKCTGRSLVVRYLFPLLSSREHRLIEVLCQLRTVIICHRPHCPDHAPKPTVLHCSSQVQALVSKASVGQLSRVTSREECKFGSGKSRSYNVEQREALVPVKLESGVKWFSGLQRTVTYKVDKSVILKAI